MSFCPKCGAQLKPEDKFCTSCGAPVKAAPVKTAPQPEEVSVGEMWMGILAYCGPVLFVPMFVKKDSEFVQYHVRQGFNLMLFYFALIFARYTLGIIPYVGTYFFRYVFDIGLIAVSVFSIIGIVHALQGAKKPLPWFGDKIDLLKTLFKR